MTKNRSLLRDYRSMLPLYQRIEPIALKIINDFAAEEHFFLMTVQSRIKQESSFAEKTVRKNDTIHSIGDVTDLLGIRIICYFSDDVDRICCGLLDRFVIDRNNSVDKRKGHSADQFGYMSVHGIFSLKPDESIPEDLLGHKFEVQVRTVLQHAWAEIEHDLGYKSEYGVPTEIRRRFSMVASLMELGDQEFITLRDSSRSYTREIREKIALNDVKDISINTVSLHEFMKSNQHMLLLYQRVLTECGVEIIHGDCSSYIPKLNRLDIDTLDRLEQCISRNEDTLVQLIRDQMASRGLDLAADSLLLKLLLLLPKEK